MLNLTKLIYSIELVNMSFHTWINRFTYHNIALCLLQLLKFKILCEQSTTITESCVLWSYLDLPQNLQQNTTLQPNSLAVLISHMLHISNTAVKKNCISLQGCQNAPVTSTITAYFKVFATCKLLERSEKYRRLKKL